AGRELPGAVAVRGGKADTGLWGVVAPRPGWKGKMRVILSEAKDRPGYASEARSSLAPPTRSFAEFTLSAANGLRMTSATCHLLRYRIPRHSARVHRRRRFR